jgi:hypothetical protein
MRHTIPFFFASVVYGAAVPRQFAPPPSGLPAPADLVGGSLQAAGSATSAVGQGLRGGGPITYLPAGIVESVGSGLSSADQVAKSPKSKVRRQTPQSKSPAPGGHGHRVRRQTGTSIGGIVGGALETAGTATSAAGQGLRGSGEGPITDLPAGILESVGGGLEVAGQAAKSAGIKRQAVGDVGGIIGGALQSAGSSLQATGKGNISGS